MASINCCNSTTSDQDGHKDECGQSDDPCQDCRHHTNHAAAKQGGSYENHADDPPSKKSPNYSMKIFVVRIAEAKKSPRAISEAMR